ncbi:family 20 glycosylhydrolase (plasmid) [Streptosporangium sp. CA-135522]|uniref:family 20 glycosylhydrolase n=1 Tax=Streptosporangium sp. CA-135522 TaxID=3240072 RepID=UPI003D8E9E63
MRLLVVIVLLQSCLSANTASVSAVAPALGSTVVPIPAQVTPSSTTFTLGSTAKIYTSAETVSVGEYLGGLLRPSTGYALPVSTASPSGGIALLIDASVPGYRMEVTTSAVTIRASAAEGLFHGVQTLRQSFPAAVELRTTQPGPWTVPGGVIDDRPRFAYRGAMLDVSRHFMDVALVKRYLDDLALYKINMLHLHLSDDQGWRIQIDSWPRLASYGGSTQVGGGPGGYYTKEQYRDLAAYAQSRYITIVPEIDLPGHTNAALASYAELNCDGVAPPLYTGTQVGFSSLCVTKEVTYRFVEDVIRELAELTPGPYIHLGGDEAHATSDADYRTFMNRVMPLAAKYGKKVAGWNEITKADPAAESLAQYWGTATGNTSLAQAAQRGVKVLMSPANKAYLDMKYNASTPYGLSWAGYIEVRTAYNWNPGTHVTGVPESAVLGLEAPLWSETLSRLDQVEFMAFPRLPALAEAAWSPQSARVWNDFRVRLAAHGPRWDALGITYYRSTQIPWSATGGTNLAQGRPVTVSSTEVAQFPGSAAVDGNTSTRWSSGYSDPQWIRVDLGSAQTVNRVVLTWETAYARAYKVQLSDDGNTWHDVYSTTAGDGGLDQLTVSGTGRYLRVYSTARATRWGVSLWELAAYAT